jgi:WD40 repeat protein
VASAGKDRTVRLTEAATGKLLFSLAGLDEVLGVAASPDGRWVVAAGADATVSWWDVRSGKRERVGGAHHGAVMDVGFSRDGRVLASAGADNTLRLWKPDGSAERMAMPLPCLAYAAALSPDGKLAAAACFDGQVRLFETEGGRPRLSLLACPADGGEAHWLALAPQGYLIGSPKLLIDGKWTMGGREVAKDTVWRALFHPEAVGRAARGESVPAPSFPAAGPRR